MEAWKPSPLSSQAEPRALGGRLSILVVDDDSLDRLAVRRCLQQAGLAATMDEASSAAEVLERLSAAVYDCVLLDYYLPAVDGLALLDQIRAAAPHLPVVIFTGRGDEEIAVALMKAGVSDYLPKGSLTPDRLVASIRHAVELERAAAARQRAEQELREQEARFRTLINAIPQLAWMTDVSGARFWYNQRWLDYTGTTLEQVQGWGWQQVHHPEHVQRVTALIQRSLAAGEPWEDTFPLRGRDGSYRWFLSRSLPIRDDLGTIVGWLGTNTDITEQKQAEEERARLYALERAARAEAEAALQARDAFFASVTHDLKNPLGRVKGYAQLLRRRLARTGQLAEGWLLEGLEQIESGANRTIGLIEDLLDLARHREVGSLELQRERFDLLALCRAIAAEQHDSGDQHQLELVAEIPELVGDWDRRRLERLIGNLVGNAVKYSPNGGPIELRLERQERAGEPWVVLSVRDHGMGIPAAELARIFEPFNRASNAADRIPGTGIGLTIVRQIAEAHGGAVEVASQEGTGTTFTVRLPLQPPEST